QATLLRDDQQLAVGAVEEAAAHRSVGRVHVDADARACARTAVAGHGEQAIDEVDPGPARWHRQRIPAQLVRRHRAIAEILVQARLRIRLEAAVHRRRTDPVQPAAPVGVARRGERRARELLGIEPVRHPLRRVPPHWQRPGHRFGGELVAKTRHVIDHGCLPEKRLPRICAGGQAQRAYSTPRSIWSRSIDSNSAWKLPSPKPSLPLRWMISKKIGPNAFLPKICSSLRCLVSGSASIRIALRRRRSTSSPWSGTRWSMTSK